jgi:hypothetical protein
VCKTAGLLFYLCFEHVDNLGAYSIPSETGLLLSSANSGYRIGVIIARAKENEMAIRWIVRLTLAATCLALNGEAVAQQDFAALEAVKKLNLPTEFGDVPVYFSGCCKQRALEVQATLGDYLRFYKERLGIPIDFAVAVLDKDDWSRVEAQNPTHARTPYGMTHWIGPPYVAFVPADDGGIITQSLLADRAHESSETRALLGSVHLSFDQAASKFILHPAMHELGHRLIREYGISVRSQEGTGWFFEILASYFAYAYEKVRRPEIATVVEAVAAMSPGPLKYSAPEDFTKTFPLMAAGDSSNFIWYQHQFEARIVDVYRRQGLKFLPDVKAAFSGRDDEMSPAELMAKLEKASPGFQSWATQLANVNKTADSAGNEPSNKKQQ